MSKVDDRVLLFKNCKFCFESSIVASSDFSSINHELFNSWKKNLLSVPLENQ